MLEATTQTTPGDATHWSPVRMCTSTSMPGESANSRPWPVGGVDSSGFGATAAPPISSASAGALNVACHNRSVCVWRWHVPIWSALGFQSVGTLLNQSVTVTVAVPLTLLPHLPVIVAVPAATPVTVAVPPVLWSSVAVAPSTVATSSSLVSQYTTKPPLPSP